MVKLPYLQIFKDRAGKRRVYFRKPGLPRVALPDPRDTAAFMRAYRDALEADRSPARVHVPETVAALLTAFKASPEWQALKPASRYAYQRQFKWMESQPDVLNVNVRTIRRKHVVNLRDRLSARPATANMFLAVLSRVLAHGVERGMLDFNPALHIKPYPGGEYRSWTDAELAQFEARWPRGTTERLIYELALYTGQRRGDIAKMTWGDVKDGAINVVQGKTGARLAIPCHPSLSAELAAAQRDHAIIVASPSGRSFTPGYLGAAFAKAIDGAGLPSACVLHGLRKAAARRLAEAGCSEREIMAITGHKSVEMVSRYTRQADQKKMASAAILRLKREP